MTQTATIRNVLPEAVTQGMANVLPAIEADLIKASTGRLTNNMKLKTTLHKCLDLLYCNSNNYH